MDRRKERKWERDREKRMGERKGKSEKEIARGWKTEKKWERMKLLEG